jgi:carboxymethylenebutenolidase
MDQRIIDLYDEYTHAPLERRVFLARLAQLTGSAAAAMALVPLLEANQAHAALVPP